MVVQLNDMRAKSETGKYLQYLKQNRSVSKIKIANTYNSESIAKIVSGSATTLSLISQIFIHLQRFERDLNEMFCQLVHDAGAEPILQEIIDQLNDYYVRSNRSGQDFTNTDFNSSEHDVYRAVLTALSHNSLKDCKSTLTVASDSGNIGKILAIWLDKLTPFRTKQEHFLEETRLDGTFSRWVITRFILNYSGLVY